MRILILITLFISLNSCFKNADSSNTHLSDTLYLDIHGQEHKHLASIPDSLRTLEQQETIAKIHTILLNHVHVKNDKHILDIGKEAFLKTGLSERYYHMLQQNLSDINVYTEKNDVKNTEQMVNDNKKKLKALLDSSRVQETIHSNP